MRRLRWFEARIALCWLRASEFRGKSRQQKIAQAPRVSGIRTQAGQRRRTQRRPARPRHPRWRGSLRVTRDSAKPTRAGAGHSASRATQTRAPTTLTPTIRQLNRTKSQRRATSARKRRRARRSTSNPSGKRAARSFQNSSRDSSITKSSESATTVAVRR